MPTPYVSFAEVEIPLEALLVSSVGHPPADAVTDAEKLRVDGKGLFDGNVVLARNIKSCC